MHAGARDLYRRALEAQPQDDSLRERLARVLMRAGELDEAQQVYESWLASRPGSTLATDGLARVWYQRGEYARAESGYRRSAALQPRSGEPRYNLACCLALQSRHDEAMVELARAIALSPEPCLRAAREDHHLDALPARPDFRALLAAAPQHGAAAR